MTSGDLLSSFKAEKVIFRVCGFLRCLCSCQCGCSL